MKELRSLFYLFNWSNLQVCEILVSQLVLGPASPVVESLSLNHCTAREVLTSLKQLTLTKKEKRKETKENPESMCNLPFT